MDVLSVSLPEVLAASSVRAASLVPETSGYLALAIADASARLPFRLDDGLVSLTTEGTVKVGRGTVIVTPDESARRVRDVLARLLAQSIGSAPGLATAARPRRETADGVDGFIRELEAALVPVNRAAARRALARLARETVRARDAGKLRRKKARRLELDPLGPPSDDERNAPPAEARPRANAPDTFAYPPVPPPAPPALAPAPAPAPARAHEDEGAVDVDFSALPVAAAAPAPEPAIEATPFDPEPPCTEELPTTVDAAVAEIEQAPKPPRAPAPPPPDPFVQAFATAKRSNVDDLLARFVPSDLTSAEGMSSTRASLKRLAGLDATPPPPSTEELKKLTQRPPAVAAVALDALPEPKRSRGLSAKGASVAARTTPWLAIVLIALGLVIAGLLGHYLPVWLDGTTAALG